MPVSLRDAFLQNLALLAQCSGSPSRWSGPEDGVASRRLPPEPRAAGAALGHGRCRFAAPQHLPLVGAVHPPPAGRRPWPVPLRGASAAPVGRRGAVPPVGRDQKAVPLRGAFLQNLALLAQRLGLPTRHCPTRSEAFVPHTLRTGPAMSLVQSPSLSAIIQTVSIFRAASKWKPSGVYGGKRSAHAQRFRSSTLWAWPHTLPLRSAGRRSSVAQNPPASHNAIFC